MRFGEKLNEILSKLDITNATLSKRSEIEASLISRYRSGTRVPSADSPYIFKISRGIVELAAEKSGLNTLNQILSMPDSASADELTKALYAWFSNSDSNLRPKRGAPEKKVVKYFDEKLNILMNTLDIPNIKMAKALNVDSSLISRYRTGMRQPSHDAAIIGQIEEYLCKQAKSPQQKIALSEVINLQAGAEYISDDLLMKSLSQWFRSTDEANEMPGMDTFLETIDSFQFGAGSRVIPLSKITPLAGEASTKESFWGIKGVQRAVIRFLHGVAIQDTPRTLYLHSDQSMAWMINDPEFTAIWASLMVHVLTKGNIVKIIHTIDRKIDEVFAAIERWVPLYMAGQIEPYYFRLSKQGRHKHTIFIAEDLSCVTSTCIAGTEERAEYVYSDDKKHIQTNMDQFQALLETCNALMKIYPQPAVNSFVLHYEEFFRNDGDIKTLLPSPSLTTMPRRLFEGVLERNQIEEFVKDKALQLFDNQKNRTLKHLENHRFIELSHIINHYPVDKNGVHLAIQPLLPNINLEYTPAEYAEHIESISTFAAQQPNYKFIPLPISPFNNIQVVFKKNVETIVVKSNLPSAFFAINNPYMCGGFEHFFEVLEQSVRH